LGESNLHRPSATSSADGGRAGYQRSKLREIIDPHQAAAIAVKRGDRVKLTDRAARGAMRQSAERGHKVNWFARRGIAVNISTAAATVQWDDRRSVDHWPANALEKA
jgi:hypothetical protein